MLSPGNINVFLVLFLPTVASLLWVRCLFAPHQPGAWPLATAYGYILGLVLTTLLLRIWDALGIGLSVGLTLSLWALLLGIILVLAGRKNFPQIIPSPPSFSRKRIQTALRDISFWLCLLLSMLVLMRLGSIALELWWRPVFAWDAWTTWALRAIVWFEHETLTPFISTTIWLEQGLPDAYPLDAAHYPKTISLLGTWMLLGFGTLHDGVMHLPWLGAYIALLLGVYGHVRYYGMPVWVAMLLVYLVASLPLMGMHAALAGYADIWMALALTLGGLAWWRWLWQGQRSDLILGLALLFILPLLKIEGWVWVLPFIVATVVSRFSAWLWLGSLVLVSSLIALWWMHGGIEFGQLPMLSTLIITPDVIVVGNAFRLELGLQTEAIYAFWPHLLLWGQWHILWYFLLPGILIGVLASFSFPVLRPAASSMVVIVLMLVALFFYTYAAAWVVDGTTVNRLLLHFIPLSSFFAFWSTALLHTWLQLKHTSPQSKQADGIVCKK